MQSTAVSKGQRYKMSGVPAAWRAAYPCAGTRIFLDSGSVNPTHGKTICADEIRLVGNLSLSEVEVDSTYATVLGKEEGALSAPQSTIQVSGSLEVGPQTRTRTSQMQIQGSAMIEGDLCVRGGVMIEDGALRAEAVRLSISPGEHEHYANYRPIDYPVGITHERVQGPLRSSAGVLILPPHETATLETRQLSDGTTLQAMRRIEMMMIRSGKAGGWSYWRLVRSAVVP